MSRYINTLRFSFFWWLIGFSLVALVIYGSLATGGPVMEITMWDKLQHLGAYSVLGVYFSGLVSRRALWIVIVLLMLMSVGLEFLQAAGGQRVFDVFDMLFNGLGLVLALFLAKLGLNLWCKSIEAELA